LVRRSRFLRFQSTGVNFSTLSVLHAEFLRGQRFSLLSILLTQTVCSVVHRKRCIFFIVAEKFYVEYTKLRVNTTPTSGAIHNTRARLTCATLWFGLDAKTVASVRPRGRRSQGRGQYFASMPRPSAEA